MKSKTPIFMSCLTAWVQWLWSCFFALSFSHPYVNSPWANDSLNNSNKMKDLKFFSYLSFLLTSREFNRLFQHAICYWFVSFQCVLLWLLSLWLPYVPSKNGLLLYMYLFYHQSVGLSREGNDRFCQNLNWASSLYNMIPFL